ncbi:O-acetylhomoserine aminocarboxypropyltransferase/cysteine synthase [Clostridium estertheticum]|uniref:O-acetylhomoserine aminocarboxypropyltransferase/cysteine synthase family protein n=1 Tax=Clostridium estertheticum TaxID=238834 RepID=UPI001C0C22E9|nr:O-acetylhomoserine aminocarboxypropyltransferase/cysteine synthase family protein [Clostridium estertheticum]MBU3201028.1 O-acetylhomoserine aminocarboxypropyltransferase/cysteine synthase [Clostridium estertheticum]WAG63883.1 O-acetylhomoserine aminocarboxypropyltransferase/cysteine synthase [Clostridium estertheticum]
MKFNTKLIHGNLKTDETGATNTPLHLSNAFAHNTAEKLEGIMKGTSMGYAYTRISNPTVTSFERRIASIEGGLTATATASGMSAIYLAIMNIVECGDEIIASSGLFGGTYALLKNLKSYGINVKFLENLDEESLEDVINKNTKIVFGETLGNPKLDVLDIEEVAKVCNKHNVIFIVDSTITTPFLIRPIEYGADIVIHSTSKYINGTSNSIGGIIVDGGSSKYKDIKYKNFNEYSKKFGKMAYTAKLRNTVGKDIGASLAPFNAFLNLTGIETLSLRMREHCSNTLAVAKFLSNNSKVTSVNYPSLPTSKYYNITQKYYKNGASGVLTFRLGSKENAFKFINNLKMIVNITNIGDTKTLIIHPASTICSSNTNDEKEQMGVFDDLLRLSVGIEDIEDILFDIESAINSIN